MKKDGLRWLALHRDRPAIAPISSKSKITLFRYDVARMPERLLGLRKIAVPPRRIGDRREGVNGSRGRRQLLEAFASNKVPRCLRLDCNDGTRRRFNVEEDG
jgi:hypothetical protein